MVSLTAHFSTDRCMVVCGVILVVGFAVFGVGFTGQPQLFSICVYDLSCFSFSSRLVIEPPDSYGVERWYGACDVWSSVVVFLSCVVQCCSCCVLCSVVPFGLTLACLFCSP